MNSCILLELSVNLMDQCIHGKVNTPLHAVQSKVQHDGHLAARQINGGEKVCDMGASESCVVQRHPRAVNHHFGGVVIVHHNF